MRIQPVVFTWREVDVFEAHGEVRRAWAMVPIAKYTNVAKRQFGTEVGEHVLEPTTERDMRSHNAFFAAIGDHFDNLPETVAARWPTATHFRRWLLVECGWFDEKEFECASEEQANGLARYFRDADDFARIFVRGKKVLLRTPKSQAVAAMRPSDFKKCKADCLDLAENLTGVPRGQAMKEAGRSA